MRNRRHMREEGEEAYTPPKFDPANPGPYMDAKHCQGERSCAGPVIVSEQRPALEPKNNPLPK